MFLYLLSTTAKSNVIAMFVSDFIRFSNCQILFTKISLQYSRHIYVFDQLQFFVQCYPNAVDQ